LALMGVLVGAIVSVVLGVVLKRMHDDNEARLSQQRTLEPAAVLMVAVPGIESSLVSAPSSRRRRMGNWSQFSGGCSTRSSSVARRSSLRRSGR
jgi:hypothetical protein